MKRTIIIKLLTIVFLTGMYISCSESRLDLKPLSDTEASYFTEEIHFQNAILGVYAKMSDWYWFGNNDPIHAFWLLPGDDLTTDGDVPFEVFTTLNPSNGFASRYFQTTYQIIARANVVLEKIDDEELTTVITTAGLKNSIKGEALFLRSYAFMQLWNYFGTSPLVTERIKTQDAITQPSSDGMELLEQAIADLGTAATLLPDSWSVSDRGRVTKNAAYGLLGKAQVIHGSWTGSSASYSAAISNFAKITGRSLTSNFADNFNVSTENNEESLFEYQAGNTGDDNVWLSNDFNQAIGSFSAYWGFFDGHWSFWAGTPYVATAKLQSTYETGDPRAEVTYNADNSRIRKYVTNTSLSSSGVASNNNPRILRYADVLLLWAEALNETGDQNGAIAKINQVRERARNMDVTGMPADRATGASQAQVRTWIQEERLMELAGEEGHRWIDLRRWHKAGHINLASWDFSSRKGNFNIELPKHLLFPIPTSETDRNPNVVQNEGY
jgi:starch-binding outer membrane protein, SusD/RagB family